MSFSGEVKAELEKHISKSRHCQLAELAAIISFSGRMILTGADPRLEIATEHAGLAKKCYTLLKRAFDISAELSEQNPGVLYIEEQDAMRRVLMALKFLEEDGSLHPFRQAVNGMLLQKSCCRRTFVRGAFLASGSMSDPHKSYHFEIVCNDENQAEHLKEMMNSFGVDAKIVQRKRTYVVYLKEGSQIVDILNVMEAHVALMELENVRIVKEMRNSVNRKVNCETANINKTVSAAVRQMEDITYIRDQIGFDKLPEGLRDVALTRLAYPEAALKELGQLMASPLGKSGVNHRLRKLSEIAQGLREQQGGASRYD